MDLAALSDLAALAASGGTADSAACGRFAAFFPARVWDVPEVLADFAVPADLAVPADFAVRADFDVGGRVLVGTWHASGGRDGCRILPRAAPSGMRASASRPSAGP